MNPMITARDLVSMKLLHYFVTKKNYNPIIVQGVENEIWLENLDEEYKVVRIVSNYIHNDEQLDFDAFKTKRMVSKIKRKTFSFKMKVLTIITDFGDNVDISKTYPNISLVFAKDEDTLKDNELLNSVYKDLIGNLEYSEEGFQLFFKISNELNEHNKEKAERTENLFKPKKVVVTYILMTLLIVIYLIQLMGYDAFLVNKFAVYGPLIKKGEVYRLFTGTLLHGGIFHVACNVYCLYILGNQIESFFGKTKMLLIYIFSGLLGSLLSITLSGNAASIGASGAICGLFGSLIYFGYYYRVYFGSILKDKIIPTVLLNLIIGLTIPGIDNWAHLGGIIGGFLMSMILGIPSESNESTLRNRTNGIVITLILTGFLIYLGIIK